MNQKNSYYTCVTERDVILSNLFLLLFPDRLQLPQTGRASMSVVEVDDPQLIILLHFMTPFMSIQPVFESPLARPASLQGSMASQLLIDLLRDRPGAHGMLLVSIEQDGKLNSYTAILPTTTSWAICSSLFRCQVSWRVHHPCCIRKRDLLSLSLSAPPPPTRRRRQQQADFESARAQNSVCLGAFTLGHRPCWPLSIMYSATTSPGRLPPRLLFTES